MTTEERLTELEVRYTLQQELIQALNDVLVEHGRELARVRRDVELLRSRIEDPQGPLPADEKPPHY